MPRRLSWLGWLLVVLILLAFVLGSIAANAVRTGCHIFSVDGDAYAATNREILAPIPRYPGSQFINTTSSGDPYLKRCFPMENSGPYRSFTTYMVYGLPRTTKAADVFAFYDRYFAKGGWAREAFWTFPAPGSRVTYTRGTVLISVRAVIGGYSLSADHDTTD